MYFMNSINLSNMPTPPYFWWVRHLFGVEQTIPLNEIEEYIVTNCRKSAPSKHIHIPYWSLTDGPFIPSKPDRKLHTQQQAQAVLESKHIVIHENLSEYPTWCSFWYGYCRAAMHQVWYSPCIMWKSLGLGSHILELTVNHPFSQAI